MNATGTPQSGRLTIMDIRTMEYWQIDVADELYSTKLEEWLKIAKINKLTYGSMFG